MMITDMTGALQTDTQPASQQTVQPQQGGTGEFAAMMQGFEAAAATQDAIIEALPREMMQIVNAPTVAITDDAPLAALNEPSEDFLNGQGALTQVADLSAASNSQACTQAQPAVEIVAPGEVSEGSGKTEDGEEETQGDDASIYAAAAQVADSTYFKATLVVTNARPEAEKSQASVNGTAAPGNLSSGKLGEQAASNVSETSRLQAPVIEHVDTVAETVTEAVKDAANDKETAASSAGAVQGVKSAPVEKDSNEARKAAGLEAVAGSLSGVLSKTENVTKGAAATAPSAELSAKPAGVDGHKETSQQKADSRDASSRFSGRDVVPSAFESFSGDGSEGGGNPEMTGNGGGHAEGLTIHFSEAAVDAGSFSVGEQLQADPALAVSKGAEVVESRRASAAEQAQPYTAPKVVEAEVYEKLSSGFRTGLKNGGGEVRLSLNPEHLGAMKINIKVEENAVKAHIVVESEAVKAVLDSDSYRVKEILGQQGLTLDKYTVELGKGEGFSFNAFNGNSGSWEQREAFGGGARGGAYRNLNGGREEGLEKTAQTHPVNNASRRGGVDLFI